MLIRTYRAHRLPASPGWASKCPLERPSRRLFNWACLLACVLAACLPMQVAAKNNSALVAVAANFADVAMVLAKDFAKDGETVKLSVGSTGLLFARIRQGAPYDVFLSADQARPRLLVEDGTAVQGSRFTYAVGRLALWSTMASVSGQEALDRNIRHLAMANPAVAPYGAAARETLNGLDRWARLKPRAVFGQNVGQVASMVLSGNAELGFVALANVINRADVSRDNYWIVPAELHMPIRQDAVLTRYGRTNDTARRFLTYLRSARAAAHLRAFGYTADS